MRILVADKLDTSSYGALQGTGIEIDDRAGIGADDLLDAVAGCDALVVRSRSKVTEEVLARGDRLQVVGRAGTGVDNIDVAAATRRGVLVMNTPGGNSNSAAEHTICLMMALARNVVPAATDLGTGSWNPKRFTGVELAGKWLGLVGLGRIGLLVAEKARGLGMDVIGYDPIVSPDVAARYGIELGTLHEVVSRADYVSVHAPLTESTRHLIDRELIASMRDDVRIVNCARGGIVDEQALHDAIVEGKVAGAAMDVFETEPPASSPLLGLDRVLATPHLGASTVEAQANVARAILQQIGNHLQGRGTVGALNGFVIDPATRDVIGPWLELARRLGRIMSGLQTGSGRLVARYYGPLATANVRPLTSHFLLGLLGRMSSDEVNEVSSFAVATERGMVVDEVVRDSHKSFQGLIYFSLEGESRTSIAGTLFGKSNLRVVRIGTYNLDAIPEGWMLVVSNEDCPGTIGAIGSILGTAGVNIAQMALGRHAESARALAVLNVDSKPDARVLAQLRELEAIKSLTLLNAESDDW